MALTDGVFRLDSTTVSYFTNMVRPKIIAIKRKYIKRQNEMLKGYLTAILF